MAQMVRVARFNFWAGEVDSVAPRGTTSSASTSPDRPPPGGLPVGPRGFDPRNLRIKSLAAT